MARSIEQIENALGNYFPALVRHARDNNDLIIAASRLLDSLEEGSLSWAKLNQIMHLCSQAGMSQGFYKYYFLTNPKHHPYKTEHIFEDKEYKPPEEKTEVYNLEQLNWGVRRFIVDSMLYWGNFRQAYRDLRDKSYDDIEHIFKHFCLDKQSLVHRGAVVPPENIPRDERYLITEMACKTFEAQEDIKNASHVKIALECFEELSKDGKSVNPSHLKALTKEKARGQNQLALFDLLYEDTSENINSKDEVMALYQAQHTAFKNARQKALSNTKIYLSICNDLDVYVATSMRTREDFREMAKACKEIFSNRLLSQYNTRYFDPTLSAANYHEDKGIIECLMVKTCKVLLYFAQHKESLGKVSELAMALSLGKPVIILCPSDARGTEIYEFYLEKHPLLRLVEFKTGVVNGALVTQDLPHVAVLLDRIFSNQMEYNLEKKANTEGYYLLKERLTKSTFRIITDDQLLTETFWNNYHSVY